MKKVFTLLFILVTMVSYSQRVFKTDNQNQADYTVFIEDRFISNADWIIMKTSWSTNAKDGRWLFVESINVCDFSIYITTNRSEADKIIFYTEWTSQIKFKR